MKFFDKLRKNSNANNLSSSQQHQHEHENLLNNNGLSYFSQQGTLNRMIVQGQEQFLKNMSNRKSVLDDIPDNNHEIEVKINNEFINDEALKKYGTSRQDFVPEGSQWFPRMRNSKSKGSYCEGDADSLDSYSSVYIPFDIIRINRAQRPTQRVKYSRKIYFHIRCDQ